MTTAATDNSGRLGRLWRLTLKELREILRDRRTILTLVLMPLLLYPLLSIAFQQFFLSQLNAVDQPVFNLAFRNPPEGASLVQILRQGGLTFDEPGLAVRPEGRGAVFTGHVDLNPEEALQVGRADLVIRPLGEPRGDLDPRNDLELDLELLYRDDSAVSREAADLVTEGLRKAGEKFLDERLKVLQVSQRSPPILAQRRSVSAVAPPRARISLAAVIPLILTLMTVTGAVYPAIDLTAGERERGTLEVLMAAPIPRVSLLFGKYVAVLVVALLTAAANLLMMTITLQASGLGKAVFGAAGFNAATLGSIFALLLLFAAFYAALLLVVTCTARSFKEAQAYLIPLMLLSLAPGTLGLMPGLALDGLLLVMPLANIVLLGRDLLTDQVTAGAAVAVVGSTAVYAAAAIGLASRIFGAESVLYSSSSGWHDLWRRSSGRQPAPSLIAAVVTVAVIFPLFFLLQGIGQILPGMLPRLQLGSVVTGLAFGFIPAVVCWFARVDFRRWYALGDRARSPLVWLGTAALGLSLWIPDHELIVAVARFRGVDFAGLLERLTSYLGDLGQIPVGWIVALIAVVPAVFEEFFFRGFLWSAIEHRDQTDSHRGGGQDTASRTWTAWWITSLVFGAFHLIMPNPLALERLLATTAMGFALGWVRRRTGSVLPGTLLHILHNAAAVLIPYYSIQLAEVGLGQDPTTHIPTIWLVTSALLIAFGLSAVWKGTAGRDAIDGPPSPSHDREKSRTDSV